jgi:hypothetical protein
LAGGIGSAIAPWFSSQVVEITGNVRDALIACLAIQGIVLFSVVLITVYSRRIREGHVTSATPSG